MKRLALLAALVAACAHGWNDPLPTTPTASNPCGAAYVPCLDMAGEFNHMCCNQHNTCGGGKFSVGCPEGECCFIGGPTGTYGASTAHTKQFSVEEAQSRQRSNP